MSPLPSAITAVTLIELLLAPAPPPLAPAAACPADMQRVRGTHHEQLQRYCTRRRGNKCVAFLPGLLLREPRVTTIDTCMDRYEWPNREGHRPEVMMTFDDAEATCTGLGKRLCTEFEWELACEGPDALPWPYGYTRRRDACNSDRPYRSYRQADLISPDRRVRDRETARLYQAVPSGTMPECVSHFGVADLVGNVEEWVTTSRPEWPHRSSLKGGYWSKPYSGCRGTNERHDPRFFFYEIGFRCCRDPQPS